MPYTNQASLFKVVSTNPKAPALRVIVNIDGIEYCASLWPATRRDGSEVRDRNGNRIYSGPVEPRQLSSGPSGAPREPEEDVELPF